MTAEYGTARGQVPLDRAQVESFLLECGTDRLAHPGGTLLAHLRRVAGLIAGWGGGDTLQAAALCHACYGTDGYPHPLLPLDERGRLADLIGPEAEALVYRYGSCDRGFVYPQLGGPGPVDFRDRFTGETHELDGRDLRPFMELTAANELDVLAHNPELADRHGAGLFDLFTRGRGLLTEAAWRACADQLGGSARPAEAGLHIERLDHLVLTVADVDRTIGFYQRVLGMEPVTFGEGRRALSFGLSKINLHRAGHEITPHAARPTPGSADLCLITSAPPGRVLAQLAAEGVSVESGPVPRTGALGPIISVYFRDPDGNLIEVSSYGSEESSDGREESSNGRGESQR